MQIKNLQDSRQSEQDEQQLPSQHMENTHRVIQSTARPVQTGHRSRTDHRLGHKADMNEY